jgi:hypothetical protein
MGYPTIHSFCPQVGGGWAGGDGEAQGRRYDQQRGLHRTPGLWHCPQRTSDGPAAGVCGGGGGEQITASCTGTADSVQYAQYYLNGG